MVREGIALTGCILAMGVPGASAGAAVQQLDLRGCRHAFSLPSGLNDRPIRRAVTCLINVQRYAHALPLLRPSRRLRHAAEEHSRDMAARGYFGHAGPGGPTLSERLRLAGVRPLSASEVVARADGLLASPFGIVVAWLHSPDHRAHLLDPDVTRLGTGVVAGDGGALYTTDLARPY